MAAAVMPLLPVILICDVACDVAESLGMGPKVITNKKDFLQRRMAFPADYFCRRRCGDREKIRPLPPPAPEMATSVCDNHEREETAAKTTKAT